MQLVNIILSMGLIILILGITVLSACTLEATTSGVNFLGYKAIDKISTQDNRRVDRRKHDNYSFPFSCADGTTVCFDRRCGQERRLVFTT